MSYFADLDLRLRADRIDPQRVPCPTCSDCGQGTRIIGYEHRRLVFACSTPRCIARRRSTLTAAQEARQ